MIEKLDTQKPMNACCRMGLTRRVVVGGIAGAVASPVLAQGGDSNIADLPPQVGDYLVLASSDDPTTPLKPEDIVQNAGLVQAFAVDPATKTVRDGNYLNVLVLTRWDPAVLSPEGQEYAAGGVVAQSGTCTHEGCDVVSWIPENFWMECPCHNSQFDPRQNGAVMQGPATRKLPALALKLEDGIIVVAKEFDGRVGGDS